jgi:hypothetical protein
MQRRFLFYTLFSPALLSSKQGNDPDNNSDNYNNGNNTNSCAGFKYATYNSTTAHGHYNHA